MARAAARRASQEAAEPTLSLAERAYTLIEEMIVTMELPPGSLISEILLSKRLNIGRTPVREALHRLARERMVVILARRGIFVSDINVGVQLRLVEARREVERLIARAAARRATPAERDRLRQIAQGMLEVAEQNDSLRFVRLDRDFNVVMAQAARNEFATSALSLMSGLARRFFWYVDFQRVADVPQAARLHAAVALAAADGDAEAAAAASDKLLDYIEVFTRATLDLGV